MKPEESADAMLLRRWVDTWRRAGVELEVIQRHELQSVDTQQAIRQIFGDGDLPSLPPAEPTSGLIEQQTWFGKIHRARNDL